MPQRQQQNRAAGYIVSPSRLVTFLYVVLFVVVIALGSTFVARKRGRLARLAARQERITHSKETGEFKDALLTIGMALQSELRHFHVGAHLSDGLKSRVLDQMGQLDLALRNTTEESLAATDAELKAAAGDKPVKVDALGQIKAKVALWASKIGQDIERFQVSQRKRRGRARQDLVGIFQILNSRSHYQIIQQYGEDGVYRRMHRRQPKLGNDEAKPDKKLPRAEELDPEVKAEMLLESLNARQDLGLTLDRLYARVSALTDLTFGVQLAAKINDMVATVAEVRTRQAQLDDQVTRLRETQSTSKKGSTKDRLDALAAIQKERSKANQRLREVKDDLATSLAVPTLKSQINFLALQKLRPQDLPDVLRELQNCIAVKGIQKDLLKIFEKRDASNEDEAVRDREAGVAVMKFAKLGNERPDLVHAPGALHHMLPFEWIVGDGSKDNGREPYSWWKGYPRAEINEIEELRGGQIPDLPVVGGKPRRGKLSDRIRERRNRGRYKPKGRQRKRVKQPSKEDIEFLKQVQNREAKAGDRQK